MMERLRSIVKDTVELNLRSLSTLFTLSKEYVRALDGIVRTGGGQTDATAPAPAQEPTAPSAPNTSPEPRRPPILLVGELAEQVSGAFLINNPSADNLNLTFAVQGQIAPDDVALVPSSVSLKAGEEAVVRIKVKLTPAFQANRDYVGMVVIPGMSRQVVDFVVRCLPAAPGRAKASRSKAAN
jgi:hypothetical protein